MWDYNDCVVKPDSWEPCIDTYLENEICYCKLSGMQVGWAVSKQGERLQELYPNPFLDTKPCTGYFQWLIFSLHFISQTNQANTAFTVSFT